MIKARQEIYRYKGVDLPINADSKYKVVPLLVERLADEFLAALELHSKILAVRFDLHPDGEHEGNKAVEGLIRWLKNNLRRNYRMNNIGHYWVRELCKKRKGTHWHVVLLLDGNKVQTSWTITESVKRYWEEIKTLGCVFIPQNCYTKIGRDDTEAFNVAFYRSSYMAKERSKQMSQRVRGFGCSNLARKLAA